ncbi:MAG: hypothetical protein ACI841_004804 [Planctomycetota bacterium]|jgi:hypothetical protein
MCSCPGTSPLITEDLVPHNPATRTGMSGSVSAVTNRHEDWLLLTTIVRERVSLVVVQ